MPILPYEAKNAVLRKSPRLGNKGKFSNGETETTIKMWEVWNRRVRRQVTISTKIFNDETVSVLRTHNPLASELASDDRVIFGDYEYSVQQVQPVKTPYGLKSYDYEVSVR